ncbi:MAG: hypothetical protein ABIJ59_01595 [Pseudomonadota bacterium]
MIDNVTAISLKDLQDENATTLETIGEELLSEWKTAGKKALWLGIGMSAFFVGLLLITWNMGDDNKFFIIILTTVCFLGIVWSIKNIVSGISKFYSTPPLAGKTAEESLVRFFEACTLTLYINHFAKMGVVPAVEAFTCLLNKAKKQTGQHKGFVETLRNDAQKFCKELIPLFKELSEADIEIEELKSVDNEGLLVRYECFFSLTAYKGLHGNSVNPIKEIGKLRLKVDKQLAEIGGRFYLTDARCNWTILK